MAVEHVFGATVAWHCEVDPGASKVLAARWPGIPNLGDITQIDFGSVLDFEPIDILCGGYPCQPFSAAGQRKGTADERHLWPYFAEAIRHLRPRYVVLENVAGHRSMGFDRVLADLARLGYDTQWCSIRASDVGVPHRRERLFVLATDAAGDGRHEGRPEPARLKRGSDAAVSGAGPLIPTPRASDAGPRGGTTGFGLRSWTRDYIADLLPTPRSSRGASTTETSYALGGERSNDGRTQGEVLLPTPSVADGEGGHLNRSGTRSGELLLPGVARAIGNGELLPTPTSRDGKGANQRGDESCLTGALLPTPRKSDGDGGANPLSRPERMDDVETRVIRCGAQWGKYEPAIRRWESVTRPAPSPTEPNTKGNPRLSAAFSEWMMGWPDGWVTAVPGISRNEQLRIIGNGVVPQQAISALDWLLNIWERQIRDDFAAMLGRIRADV
jgi:DNA (cytosine-5)-methyltransferase 1